MKQYADIITFDKKGQITLIVEVKNKRNTTSEWAAKMRRNMFSHGLLPDAPFFLLALPDVFYLWKNVCREPEVIKPTIIINPKPFLQPYFDAFGFSSGNITEKGFEVIVTSWLNQVFNIKRPQDLPEHQDWLINSGLFEKLAGGHLELAVAA